MSDEQASSLYLQQIDNEGQDVEEKEHNNDTHEHGGHPDFALLMPSKFGTFRSWTTDLDVDPQIEQCKGREWDDVHHYQVHPSYVHTGILKTGA